MKIDVSFYQHETMPGKICRGCLVRVRFGAWRIGYADLHPWIEYGDAAIEEQFSWLMAGKKSRLMSKLLQLAAVDADGRRQRRNLLIGLQLPTSHALLGSLDLSAVNDAYERGFRHFKIKMGKDIKSETAFLQTMPNARLRLDFNSQLSYSQFSEWWKQLDDACRSRIDVIEDAYYGEGTLPQSNLFYSDWTLNLGWRGRIFKPARDFSFQEYKEHRFQHVIFTHSLDHPLAQVGAIWECARFYRRYPFLRNAGGFSQASDFEDFYRAWNSEGPKLRAAPGTGFGFDELLASQSWESMC